MTFSLGELKSVVSYFDKSIPAVQNTSRSEVGPVRVFAGDKHILTPKGEAAGVEFVAKGRFGPYFLWPQDFHPV